jgi:acetyl esterase/lipase
MLKGHLSAEAQRFLCNEQPAPSGRSESQLADLRSATKAYITPAVKQVLASTKVTTRHIVINDVACLEVTPSHITASWPILYGFGGGFIQGSAYEDLTIAAPLCAMTGAALIIPSYRLAPEHPWPAAIDDGFSVYQALCDRPFAIVGESAGGNLALALMLRAKQAGLNLPCAAALLSPWCDLSVTSDSQSFNDGRDPTLTTQDSIMAAKLYAGKNNIANPDISPINGDFDKSFPPFLITTGTRDLLLSLSVRLASILRKKGIDVDLHVWEGLWHVFEWDDSLPESNESIKNIAAFLLRYIKQ